MLAVALRNRIERLESGSQRQTRQTGNIVLEFRKSRNARKSKFYEGMKMYNSLPAGIKQRDRPETFKRVKEYIPNTMQYF